MRFLSTCWWSQIKEIVCVVIEIYNTRFIFVWLLQETQFGKFLIIFGLWNVLSRPVCCQKFRLVSRDALCWMIESSENIWQPSPTLYLCKPLYCKPASHHINELPKKRLWFGWRNETSSKVVNGRGKPHLGGRGTPEKKKATYLLFWHQSAS